MIAAAVDLDLGSSHGDSEAFVLLEGIVTEKFGHKNGLYSGERLYVESDLIGELGQIESIVLESEARIDGNLRRQSHRLETFRQALEEIVKPSMVRSSAVIKRVQVDRLRCHAKRLDRDHESVNIEPSYRCNFTISTSVFN